jgi:hypothetical protein
MKGIVFNLLEAVVTRDHGPETWDALLDAAGLDGAYTTLGNYPDDHLVRLVGAASSALQLPAHVVIRHFGRAALPLLAARYPAFFTPHADTRGFLLSLNAIIHPEVRKLYPGADTPEFVFDASSSEQLVMEYQSARRLCAFAEGMIEGAATHYGETVRIDHAKCMHDGAARCRLELTFVRVAATA